MKVTVFDKLFDIENIDPSLCKTELGQWLAERLCQLEAEEKEYDPRVAVYDGHTCLQRWLANGPPEQSARDRMEAELRRTHGNQLADSQWTEEWRWAAPKKDEAAEAYFDREAARMLAEGMVRAEWEGEFWRRKIVEDGALTTKKARTKTAGNFSGPSHDAGPSPDDEVEYEFTERVEAGRKRMKERRRKEREYSRMIHDRTDKLYQNITYNMIQLRTEVEKAVKKTGVFEEIISVATERGKAEGLSDDEIEKRCGEAVDAFKNVTIDQLISGPAYVVTAEKLHLKDKDYKRFMATFLSNMTNPKFRRMAKANFVSHLQHKGYEKEHAKRLVQTMPRWSVRMNKDNTEARVVLDDEYTHAWEELKAAKRAQTDKSVETTIRELGLDKKYGKKVMTALINAGEASANLGIKERALFVAELQKKSKRLFGEEPEEKQPGPSEEAVRKAPAPADHEQKVKVEDKNPPAPEETTVSDDPADDPFYEPPGYPDDVDGPENSTSFLSPRH